MPESAIVAAICFCLRPVFALECQCPDFLLRRAPGRLLSCKQACRLWHLVCITSPHHEAELLRQLRRRTSISRTASIGPRPANTQFGRLRKKIVCMLAYNIQECLNRSIYKKQESAGRGWVRAVRNGQRSRSGGEAARGCLRAFVRFSTDIWPKAADATPPSLSYNSSLQWMP